MLSVILSFLANYVRKKPTRMRDIRAGWDKTFYFVGTEAFGQKFRPKQRESDATKNLKNSGNSTLNGWFPN